MSDTIVKDFIAYLTNEKLYTDFTIKNYLIDLNLKAAFNVAQLVVKKMIKNKKRSGSTKKANPIQ